MTNYDHEAMFQKLSTFCTQMRPEKNCSRFRQMLRLARENKKVMQKQLALAVEIDPSYLAGIESGRRPVPRPEILKNIFDALELTKDEQNALLEAATWEKVGSYLKKLKPVTPKTQALTSLSKVFATLTDKQAITIVALIESLSADHQKEAAMN